MLLSEVERDLRHSAEFYRKEAEETVGNPVMVDKNKILAETFENIADKIRYADPVGTVAEKAASPDPFELKRLRDKHFKEKCKTCARYLPLAYCCAETGLPYQLVTGCLFWRKAECPW